MVLQILKELTVRKLVVRGRDEGSQKFSGRLMRQHQHSLTGTRRVCLECPTQCQLHQFDAVNKHIFSLHPHHTASDRFSVETEGICRFDTEQRSFGGPDRQRHISPGQSRELPDGVMAGGVMAGGVMAAETRRRWRWERCRRLR